MNIITFLVNDQVVFEYDRDTVLQDEQLDFFDKMDRDMDRGVKIRGELFSEPDNHQRATFVALNFIRAMQQQNQGAIAVSCAYLSTRLPGLHEVHVSDDGGQVKVELMEE